MKSKLENITTCEFLDFLEIDIFEIYKFSYPRTVKKTMGIEKQHIVTYRVVLRRPAEPRLSAAPRRPRGAEPSGGRGRGRRNAAATPGAELRRESDGTPEDNTMC